MKNRFLSFLLYPHLFLFQVFGAGRSFCWLCVTVIIIIIISDAMRFTGILFEAIVCV